MSNYIIVALAILTLTACKGQKEEETAKEEMVNEKIVQLIDGQL